MNGTMEWIVRVVDAIPDPVRRVLLALAFMGAMAYAWAFLRPAAIIEPVQAQITVMSAQITRNTGRLDSLGRTMDTRLDLVVAMQRWMCFQNRTDAVKSGIPCLSLGVDR